MAKKFRRKIVAGNWKMNKTVGEAVELAAALKRDLATFQEADVVLCPPFTALKAVGETLGKTAIKLGAQNMHWEASGAYTGEISAGMLRELYCHYVILGHSERRTLFGETSATVNRKVKAALAASLVPIVCVGETLQERDGGQMQAVVTAQVRESLAGLGADVLKGLIVAYEPVWAIGTGRNATPAQAQDVHALIRDVLAGLADSDVASAVRIQYGGSVKAANAAELFAQPDIDGGLIGGAALDARSFVDIVKAAV
jgi:triosephosphate isomerase (TIM)